MAHGAVGRDVLSPYVSGFWDALRVPINIVGTPAVRIETLLHKDETWNIDIQLFFSISVPDCKSRGNAKRLPKSPTGDRRFEYFVSKT